MSDHDAECQQRNRKDAGVLRIADVESRRLLEILPAAALNARASGPTGERKHPSALRILVVDDARDSAYILCKMLEVMGQSVQTALSAAEALECALSERFDMIISDIGMPQMDGRELARRLRRLPGLEGVVLVALTGFGQNSDRHAATEAGFDHYLVKPVNLEALQGLLVATSRVSASALSPDPASQGGKR